MPLRSKQFQVVRARADRGELLDSHDMQVLLRLSRSAFYRYLHRGDLDQFMAQPTIGPRRFFGAKVARYLDGDIIDGVSVQPNLFDVKRWRA